MSKPERHKSPQPPREPNPQPAPDVSQDPETLWRIIQASRNKLKAAFDAVDDPIFSLTAGLRVESLNMALAKAAQRHPRELVGQPGDQVLALAGLPSDLTARLMEAAVQVLEKGQRQCHLLQSQEGRSPRFYEATLTPVAEGEGKVALVIAQLRDVTIFKRMEKTIRDYSHSLEAQVAARTKELSEARQALQEERDHLAQANAELVRLDRLRQDLTAMVVHDLKGPLAEVMGNLDLLSYDELTETQREALDLAVMGGDDLLRMIMNLLDISRLEEGRLVVRPGRLNFSEMAETLLHKFQTLIRLKNLRLETIDETPQGFQGDPELLLRVLQNLLTNALAHTPEGGRIQLKSAPGGQGGVVISVADSGDGVPERFRERIFQKFAQADDSGQPRTSTGLGLTFCKMAVEAHGGRVWLESQEGLGATFFVWLPDSPPAPQ